MRRRPLAAAGAGLALALAAVLAGTTAAWAHDRLVASDPAEGSTVAAVSAVTLTYSAGLLGADDATANLGQVTGPDGAHYESACATVSGAAVTVPVALGAAGEYQVDWRVVSADGHPVSGSYTFDYAPVAGTTASAGTAASSCAAVAAGAAATAPSADDGSGTGLAIGLGVGGVLVVVLAVVLVVGLRRRPGERVEDEETEPEDQTGG